MHRAHSHVIHGRGKHAPIRSRELLSTYEGKENLSVLRGQASTLLVTFDLVGASMIMESTQLSCSIRKKCHPFHVRSKLSPCLLLLVSLEGGLHSLQVTGHGRVKFSRIGSTETEILIGCTAGGQIREMGSSPYRAFEPARFSL